MSKEKSSGDGISSILPFIVIPLLLVVSILIYMFVLGNSANFEGGDNSNHPLPGNYLGIVYKGGVVVPVLIWINLIVVAFFLERFITISKSKGKGSVPGFIGKIKSMLSNNQIDDAIAACDAQRGSLANVVRAGLTKYKHVESDGTMEKESKIAAIQKELEEATSLELPMMSKNLAIISTMASTSTLIGLIGTVLGMIKAFAALAQAGAPDAVALANGISEALINTALGITGSTLAIFAYNYFTTKIDALTYGMDEAGFSIIQTFNAKHKN